MSIAKFSCILCLIWITFIQNAVCQKEANIWYFGNGQGLSFNDPLPFSISDSLSKSTPTIVPATICDSAGNLVLRSNGKGIYNGKTKRMSNISAMFSAAETPISIINNYIISVSKIPEEYAIFSSAQYWDTSTTTFKGTIRMQRVGFAGAENDSLIQLTPTQEVLNRETSVAAFKKQGNDYYWMSVYAPITGRLYIYKLDAFGLIQANTYWIDTTNQNPNQVLSFVNWNMITFSSDGSQLAIGSVYPTIHITLCDFDQLNGTISSIRKINNVSLAPMELSYSGEFIYISSQHAGDIYQCKTQFTNAISLFDTGYAKKIAEKTGYSGALIGPDKKIYLGGGSTRLDLGIIHYPDKKGSACNFDSNGIASTQSTGHLPRYPLNLAFNPNIRVLGTCLGDSTRIQLFNVEADSALLMWGDGATEHTVKSQYSHLYIKQDSFDIIYIYFRKGLTDTLEYSLSIRKLNEINLGNDSLICSGSSMFLNINDPNAEKYKWNTNSTDSAITVRQDGLYSVAVSNGQCVRTDSIEVFTIECAIAVQKTCFGDTTEISLINSGSDSVMVDFGDGYKLTASDSIYYHRFSDSGTYTARFRFYKNGLNREIVELIRIDKLPNLNLGADTILCSNNPHQYDIKNPGFDSYQWSSGNNTSYFTPDSSQEFWVIAKKNGCSTSDTAKVYIINCQIQIDSLCLNSFTKLSISEPSLDSIIWDFGDGNFGYGSHVKNQYKYSGTYTGSIKVSIDSLSKILPFTVDIEEIPKPFEDSSLTLCFGQTLELPFTFEKYQINWSEGTQGIKLIPDSSGSYSIRIQSANCQVHDSILLLLQDCACDNYTPTGFSPNKDGLNETFIPMVSCEISAIHFWIYNRWGQNIFESKSLTEGWDGTYLEQPCEPGVYMYYCKYVNPLTNTSETIKGTIHLIR